MSRETLSVAVGGDYSARDMCEKINPSFSREALKLIKPIFDAQDLRIINLESAVIKNGTPLNKSGAILPMWPENLSFLTELNISCAILANNHIGDFRDEGVLSTLKLLNEMNMPYTGAGNNIEESYKPWYHKGEVGTLALITICENEFGTAGANSPGAAGFNINRVFLTIKEAKTKADFILVVMHGGNEHYPLPAPYTVERYRLFVEFGANAVIGMHPHCIQGYEFYKNVPIVYSTGNFFFHRSDVKDNKNPWCYGYLPVLIFSKNETVKLEIHPYRFDLDCTRITPFEDDEKTAMLDYIQKLSEPIKDFSLIEKYFKGWCLIGGINYSKQLVGFNLEFFDDKSFPTGHPLLSIRNIFTCEAHNGLMNALFRMVEAGEIPLAREMKVKIMELQKMPV